MEESFLAGAGAAETKCEERIDVQAATSCQSTSVREGVSCIWLMCLQQPRAIGLHIAPAFVALLHYCFEDLLYPSLTPQLRVFGPGRATGAPLAAGILIALRPRFLERTPEGLPRHASWGPSQTEPVAMHAPVFHLASQTWIHWLDCQVERRKPRREILGPFSPTPSPQSAVDLPRSGLETQGPKDGSQRFFRALCNNDWSVAHPGQTSKSKRFLVGNAPSLT